MTDRFSIHAKLKSPNDAFEQLEVAQALDGREEGIENRGDEETVYTVYRTVHAENETEAREKADNGKLFRDVPHEVVEILEVRNIDEPL